MISKIYDTDNVRFKRNSLIIIRRTSILCTSTRTCSEVGIKNLNLQTYAQCT